MKRADLFECVGVHDVPDVNENFRAIAVGHDETGSAVFEVVGNNTCGHSSISTLLAVRGGMLRKKTSHRVRPGGGHQIRRPWFHRVGDAPDELVKKLSRPEANERATGLRAVKWCDRAGIRAFAVDAPGEAEHDLIIVKTSVHRQRRVHSGVDHDVLRRIDQNDVANRSERQTLLDDKNRAAFEKRIWIATGAGRHVERRARCA
jgi:hypothetical protein